MSVLRQVILEIKLNKYGIRFGILLYTALAFLRNSADIGFLFILGGIFLIMVRPVR